MSCLMSSGNSGSCAIASSAIPRIEKPPLGRDRPFPRLVTTRLGGHFHSSRQSDADCPIIQERERFGTRRNVYAQEAPVCLCPIQLDQPRRSGGPLRSGQRLHKAGESVMRSRSEGVRRLALI